MGVVQALVEHFSQKGQPEAVEKAVLHMDIASLDLNQVSQASFTLVPLACLHLQLVVVSWNLLTTQLRQQLQDGLVEALCGTLILMIEVLFGPSAGPKTTSKATLIPPCNFVVLTTLACRAQQLPRNYRVGSTLLDCNCCCQNKHFS